MKDDTSTPTPEGSAPNDFERGMPATAARDAAEAAIEDLRARGGVFVNAVRATRMPMVLTDPNLPGNPIVFANDAFVKLTGYSMKEVLGQQPHFMNGPSADPKDAARFEEALRSDQDDIIETVQYRKNGSRFVATVLISAFKNDDGKTLNHFMSFLDVTRRVEAEDEVADLKAAQARLHESEERQTFLLALGDAMRGESSADGKIAVAARLLGEKLGASRVLYAEYDHERGVAHIFNGWLADGAQPFPSVVKLEDFEGEVLNDLRAGRIVRVDDVGRLGGQSGYAASANVGVQALLSPPLLVDGKLKFNVSVHQQEPRHWTDDEVALTQEVSERLWAEIVRTRAQEALVKSEQHANLLLAELQHRVRNTLAVVRSIARRTAQSSGSTDDMLAHFQGRLDAFSRVQAAMTRNAEGKVDLTSLIEDELLAHAAKEGEQVSIRGPAIEVESKIAERLSLAIHELTTNAVKHGALVSGSGHVAVEWTVESNGGGAQLTLRWKERGVEVNGRTLEREGFGMELLRSSLPYDLGAETRVELTPAGLEFELRMPLKAAS